MRPTIFNDRVAAALKSWHHTAKKHTKHSRHSENTTPFSSRPATPTHGMSPVHLLHNHPRSVESYHTSPRNSNLENDQWDLDSPRRRAINDSVHDRQLEMREVDRTVQEYPSSSSHMPQPPQTLRTQHEIDISSSDFSFAKRWSNSFQIQVGLKGTMLLTFVVYISWHMPYTDFSLHGNQRAMEIGHMEINQRHRERERDWTTFSLLILAKFFLFFIASSTCCTLQFWITLYPALQFFIFLFFFVLEISK